MVFHRARLKSFNSPILINGTQLQEVSPTKYLGLIIDNKHKWIDHIAYIKNKISMGIGIITRVEPFVNTKRISNLYQAFLSVSTVMFRGLGKCIRFPYKTTVFTAK